MTCKDFLNALLQGLGSPLHKQAADHVSDCADCRRLLEALGSPVPRPATPSATPNRIEAALTANLRPVRPIPPRKYVFITLEVILVAVVALSVSRMGALAIPVMSHLQAGAILGTLTASLGLLVYSLVNQIVPGSRHRISPRFLPPGIGVSLLLVIAVIFPFRSEQSFWAGNWSCIRAGAFIGLVAAIPLWLVLRRGAILSPAMTGAAIGFLSGLAGTTALTIHCPNLDAWHILVGHLGVAVLGAMTGFLTGAAVAVRGNGSA